MTADVSMQVDSQDSSALSLYLWREVKAYQGRSDGNECHSDAAMQCNSGMLQFMHRKGLRVSTSRVPPQMLTREV